MQVAKFLLEELLGSKKPRGFGVFGVRVFLLTGNAPRTSSSQRLDESFTDIPASRIKAALAHDLVANHGENRLCGYMGSRKKSRTQTVL
jgi:hypothetical protein